MTSMTLELVTPFPELKFIFSIFNRMIIQGCHIKVNIKKFPLNKNFLCIEIGRRKRIADVNFFREVYVSDAQIEEIKSGSLFLFSANDEGSCAEISIFRCYNEFPRLELPGIPEIVVPELDGITENGDINYTFILKNSFELENLVKVLNLILFRKCDFIHMSVEDEKSMTVSVTDDNYPSLSIRMDLWIPNRNSKAYTSWNTNRNGKQASRFNSLLATKKDIVGKFYLSYPSDRPSFEFRALK